MYRNWCIKRWETPVAEINPVGMVSLIDAFGRLEIIVEAFRQPTRPRWRFVFSQYPAYRNILEEHRLSLWSHLDESGQRCGYTFTVEGSPWIASFDPNEPLLSTYYPNLRHFVICTEDDIIEVLSGNQPLIESIGFAPEGAKEPGKSQHYYYPADKEKFAQLVDEVKKMKIRPN